MKKLIHEVHRRSIWQVLGLYMAGSWVVLQVVDQLVQSAGLPDWVPSLALVLLLIGFPMVLATAFVQEGVGGGDDVSQTGAAAGPDPEVESPQPMTAAAPAKPGAGTRNTWLGQNVFTWRNAIAGGVAALALFGAATAVWMVMRGAGVGSAGTLVAKGLIEDGERVVLADFSGDSALAVAATMAMRVQLAESGVVSVAEPSVVKQALRRMEIEGATLDAQRAREVAEREGLNAVVAGDVAGAGGSYILTVQVIETASGDDLVTVGETAADSADFLDAMDRLGRKLRERLGESLGSIRASAPLAKATTSSTEALRKYSRAEEAFDARDMEKTIALLDEAIALDSSFAMAWRKLAVADTDRRKDAATRAYELRDRLTERERYHAVGIYHTYVTEDLDEAVTTYRALLEAYPDDGTALNNLGVNYSNQGQKELAAEMYGRAVEVDPYTAHYYANLIHLLYETDRADSARAVLGRFDELFPDHPNVAWFHSYFAYLAGDLEATEAELQPLLDSEILSLQRQANGYVSSLRILEGKLREGERIWRQSVEDLTAFDEAMWRGDLEMDVLHDTASAMARIVAAIDVAPDSVIDERAEQLSYIFYEVGDVERGDEYYARHLVVDSMRLANTPARFQPLIQGFHDFSRAMGLGEYEAAIEIFREIDAAWRRVSSGQDPANWADAPIPAFEALGETDSVIVRYEAWLGRRDLDRLWDDGDDVPSVYERLAQLYDEKGDLENAAVYYAKFVEIWANADPDLQPRVQAAQARLEEIVRARG